MSERLAAPLLTCINICSDACFSTPCPLLLLSLVVEAGFVCTKLMRMHAKESRQGMRMQDPGALQASLAQRHPSGQGGGSQAQHIQQHGRRQRAQRLQRRLPRSATACTAVRRQQQRACSSLENRGHLAVALGAPGAGAGTDELPERPAAWGRGG